MTENEIATAVVYAANKVHLEIGPGLIKSLYQAAMVHEVGKRGLEVEAGVLVPVLYDGIEIADGLKVDLVVERLVFVELMSVEKTSPEHKQRLLTYLRLAEKRLGLLINFGEPFIKDGIAWVVNKLEQ